MVKLLHDFTSTELVSRQRNISASEARGEAGQENQQAPELPPPATGREEDEVVRTSGVPKTAKLLFANKRERDVMWREELDHLVYATRDR